MRLLYEGDSIKANGVVYIDVLKFLVIVYAPIPRPAICTHCQCLFNGFAWAAYRRSLNFNNIPHDLEVCFDALKGAKNSPKVPFLGSEDTNPMPPALLGFELRF